VPAARKLAVPRSPAEIRADAFLAQIGEAEMAALASALARLLLSAARSGGRTQAIPTPAPRRTTATTRRPARIQKSATR
jgi:hypothetical protein